MTLPSNSPMGEDIKRIIREMLEEELSIHAEQQGFSRNNVVFQFKLAGKPIGEPVTLSAELIWNTDHGHGGGSYVNGVRLKIS